jgi:methionyl-tRNA formyltransferase
MKLIFMGTPDFSVPALVALHEAGHDILCVYSQPPRPAGRGKKDRPTPVHQKALELGIPVRHPVSLRGAEEQAEFAALNADAAVVVAYGLILPQAVLDAPKHGCFNIHASLLPRWRGAAPIHRAIMAGDTETGNCIMQMEAGLDTGPVVARAKMPIEAGDTTQSLHDKLSEQGALLIADVLEHIEFLEPETQPEEGVTYAHKIDKDEARIDWSQPAEVVDRQIRGLSPFPGAWGMLGDERIKFLASEVVVGEGQAGTVLDDTLTIACGSGAVRILKAQRSGKSAQDTDVFLRGFPIATGAQFSV